MTIDEIREKLSSEISHNEEWINELDNSSPGHYGVEDWEVTLLSTDIWVDVPKREFTFKNAQFNFELLLGSSNSEDGAKMNFSKVADGSGTFDFSEGSKNVQILELNLNFDLSLFNEE